MMPKRFKEIETIYSKDFLFRKTTKNFEVGILGN
jgi:hypothetical protein